MHFRVRLGANRSDSELSRGFATTHGVEMRIFKFHQGRSTTLAGAAGRPLRQTRWHSAPFTGDAGCLGSAAVRAAMAFARDGILVLPASITDQVVLEAAELGAVPRQMRRPPPARYAAGMTAFFIFLFFCCRTKCNLHCIMVCNDYTKYPTGLMHLN